VQNVKGNKSIFQLYSFSVGCTYQFSAVFYERFIRLIPSVQIMLHAYLIAGVIACALGVKVCIYRENGTNFRTRCAYLLKRKKAAEAAFEKLLRKKEGLCIARALPPGREYDNTLLLDENGISAHDLEKILHHINRFIRPGNKVILLDCLEHLISENGFDETVKFLHSLKDQVVLHQAILLTTMDLDALSRREQSYVRREMDKLM